MGRKKSETNDIALQNYLQGLTTLEKHPMFYPLICHANIIRQPGNLCPKDGWAVVTTNGQIHLHPTRRGEPEEWVYILAHCLLHLGFGHFQIQEKLTQENKLRENFFKWNAACDCFVAKFLYDLKLGCPPKELGYPMELPARTEDRLFRDFCENGIPPHLSDFGTAGPGSCDMLMEPERVSYWWGRKLNWQECFGKGLEMAVTSAVNVAAGYAPDLSSDEQEFSPAKRAKNWFISSYPLLGALAASFEIIEDPAICARLDISIAAVNVATKELFINQAAGLDEHECRFVMAHEFLHAGLRHDARRKGRDPYWWNIACDYVINGWLVEMGLGELPKVGALYDPDYIRLDGPDASGQGFGSDCQL